jgi:hypothetical protein
VIVVDNAGDAETQRAVDNARDRFPLRYEVLAAGGAAAARNRGAELASGRFLLFCDDDIVVPREHLALHYAAHSEHPRALVGGDWRWPDPLVTRLKATPFGRYRLDLDRGFRAEISGPQISATRTLVSLLSACNLSVDRRLFHEIGGFDMTFPYAGAEDQDLSLRAQDAGCLLILDRAARVEHHDRWLTLREFCTREERSAQTAVSLARSFPAVTGNRPIIIENKPIASGDPLGLLAKKATKRLLSLRPILGGFHAMARTAEALSLSDRTLRPMYRSIIGLHIFRGVRRAWAKPSTGR